MSMLNRQNSIVIGRWMNGIGVMNWMYMSDDRSMCALVGSVNIRGFIIGSEWRSMVWDWFS